MYYHKYDTFTVHKLYRTRTDRLSIGLLLVWYVIICVYGKPYVFPTIRVFKLSKRWDIVRFSWNFDWFFFVEFYSTFFLRKNQFQWIYWVFSARPNPRYVIHWVRARFSKPRNSRYSITTHVDASNVCIYTRETVFVFRSRLAQRQKTKTKTNKKNRKGENDRLANRVQITARRRHRRTNISRFTRRVCIFFFDRDDQNPARAPAWRRISWNAMWRSSYSVPVYRSWNGVDYAADSDVETNKIPLAATDFYTIYLLSAEILLLSLSSKRLKRALGCYDFRCVWLLSLPRDYYPNKC